MAWRSIFIQVVEVEVEQPRGFVGILFVEWHEAIAEVEGYGCGVGIDGDEAAAGLVVGGEVKFNEFQQRTSDIHTFCRSMYGQTTNLGCRITLQPLVVVEATAEAVVLCLAVEVGNGYAVVGEAEERNNMIVVAFLKTVYVTASFSFRYNGASVRIKPFKSSSPQSNAATISCSAIL